ncbi:MAG: hypothetical protein AAFX03_12820 [Pseudomonadota bacterium]
MSFNGIFGAAAAARLEKKKRRAAAGGSSGEERGFAMLTIAGIVPLLIFPVLIYTLMAIGYGDGDAAAAAVEGAVNVAPLQAQLGTPMFTLPMVSGISWQVTGGDLLIIISIGFLFVEILKSTSTGTATIMNHAVSMLLFIVCLVLFLLFKNFGTSVFFILTLMTLLDVLAGVVVTIVSARRDFAVGEGFSG